MQYLFINNRPVFSKSILYHVNQIYRLLMPGDAFPAFALFLDLPVAELDVNIHPTKKEVKISQEQHVCSLLRRFCEQTLMTRTSLPQAHHDIRDDINPAMSPSPYRHNRQSASDQITEPDITPPDARQPNAGGSVRDYAYPEYSSSQKKSEPLTAYDRFRTMTADQQSMTFIPKVDPAESAEHSMSQALKHARYVGHFLHKYQLFESDTNLYVMDQHAAQERVNYERILSQINNGSLEVQRLLTPELITMSKQEWLVWEEARKQLEDLGFETTSFDETTVAVHTHPVLIKEIETAIRHLLAGEQLEHCDHDTIARRACRASIMAGDPLQKEQAAHLRDELLACLDPFTCPHGRPIVVKMTDAFVDKLFLRT
jgi:DNA mismatch repair protein MutL